MSDMAQVIPNDPPDTVDVLEISSNLRACFFIFADTIYKVSIKLLCAAMIKHIND